MKYIIICIILASLNSCSYQIRQSMEPSARPFFSSTDILILLDERKPFGGVFEYSNISSSYDPYNMEGAVLKYILDSVDQKRNAAREEKKQLFQPLYNVLFNCKFHESLHHSLQDKLKLIKWLNINNVILDNVYSNPDSIYATDKIDEYYSDSQASAVMIIKVLYVFSADVKSVNIIGEVFLFPRSEKLKEFRKPYSDKENNIINNQLSQIDKRNAIFIDTFWISKAITIQEITTEEAIEYWSEKDGARICKALDHGSDELAELISIEIAK